MKDKLKNNHNMLFHLFLSTLYISAFTFGGGYVIVSLMKKKFVDDYHWIDENEMLDFVAIAQSAPGPIAINGAIVVGYRLAGMPGYRHYNSCDRDSTVCNHLSYLIFL